MDEIKNLKILIITPEYPPINTGGGGLAYQQMCETLVKQGYNITVLSGDYTKTKSINSPNSEIINDISVTRLPLKPNYFNILKAKTFPNSPSKKHIIDELQKGYDCILINGAFEGLSIYVAKIAKQNKIPYFIYAHGYPNLNNYSLPVKIVFKLIEKTLLIPTFKKAKAVFSVNPNQFLPIKTIYIPNAIDPKYLNVQTNMNIRELNNIPKENIILFSLGRLSKNKGFQDVIKVVSQMKNVTYLIGGNDGGYEKDLKEISQDNRNIVFLGPLDTATKKAYYQQSDIYINPSKEEFFGLTVLEAVASNTFTLSTNLGVAVELIQPRTNGNFINIGDTEDIKTKIESFEKKALDNSEIIKRYNWVEITNTLISEIRNKI